MKKKLAFLRVASVFLAAAILFVCNTASADDIPGVSGSKIENPFQFIANISPSETGHGFGYRLGVGAYVTPGGDQGGTSVYAISPNSSGPPFDKSHPLLFLPFDMAPNEFYGEQPWDRTLSTPGSTNYAGQRKLLIQNGENWTTVVVPSLTEPAPYGITRADVPPLATSVAISGKGTTPTFTWTYKNADGTPYTSDSLTVKIWDLEKTLNEAFHVKNIIYSQKLLADTTTLTIDPSWKTAAGNTMSLQEGHQYSVGIYASTARRDAQGNNVPINSTADIMAVSMSFFDFVPLPDNAPPQVELPTTTPPGPSNPSTVYTFHTEVVQGQTIFVDPLVAVGYDYQIGVGDPRFASVKLPTGIGDNSFDLWLYNGSSYVFADHLTGGIPHSFGPGGVDRFRILGIEPSAGLDPNNSTAFITGLSFEGSGQFTGTMTPISQNVVPEPATMLLLGLGLIGVAGVRRKVR